MNWFTWRQHRKQLLTFGVLVAVYAAIAIPTGIRFWHTYQYATTHCMSFATAANPEGNCNQLRGTLFTSSVDATLRLIPIVVLFVPAIFGIFLGAPLIAREYGEGTNKLAWTQSISRRKWLSVKLAWILLASALLAAGFAGISTWWSRPINALFVNRFNSVPFSMQGIAPVAATVFVVAVGIAAGAWLRRTMAAVGVALGVFIIIGLIAIPNFVRPHYIAPVTLRGPVGMDTVDDSIPAGSWVLNDYIVDKNGKQFNSFSSATMPAECQQFLQNIRVKDDSRAAVLKAKGIDPVDDCLNRHGYHVIATFQPSYRYWDFQRIEAGIYLGMSALVIGATYWLVLKRDA